MSLVPEFNYDDFFSLRQIIPVKNFDIDVKETDTSYIIRADLPGVEKENIDVKLDNNMLKISSERKNERTDMTEKYHYFERSYGKSSRTIYLSSKVNSEDIIASYKDGVLHLTISKKN
jgi:HSP20 family protein